MVRQHSHLYKSTKKQQLTNITDFEGVSGTLNMNPSGNPEKSAVIIRISDEGKLEAYSSEKP